MSAMIAVAFYLTKEKFRDLVAYVRARVGFVAPLETELWKLCRIIDRTHI